LFYYYILAEVPGAARINMQLAKHLCPSGFRVSDSPGPGVGGGGVKPASKPSLDK